MLSRAHRQLQLFDSCSVRGAWATGTKDELRGFACHGGAMAGRVCKATYKAPVRKHESRRESSASAERKSNVAVYKGAEDQLYSASQDSVYH